MEHVIWASRPTLRRPTLIAAFEGWNDAGDAASTAARFLARQWGAEPFATIDPEEFYDFTESRPQVSFDDDGVRQVEWPTNKFSAAQVPDRELDVILLEGVEPQLRWRTFTHEIIELAKTFEARLVVTLGALLAEVPHSRPVHVVGSADESGLARRLDLQPSTYEGPTGIIGTLHTALRHEHLSSASLWAAIPTYVPGAPSPKGALALVERCAALLDIGIITTELEIASAAYERQINELVNADTETAEYVAQLEAQADAAATEPRRLVEEVERFLRDQPE